LSIAEQWFSFGVYASKIDQEATGFIRFSY